MDDPVCKFGLMCTYVSETVAESLPVIIALQAAA